MIDIHAHILPAIDDGAQTLAESIEMVKIAEQDGISAMVATPHVFGLLDQEQSDRINQSFVEFREAVAAEGVKMDLYLASEVFIHPDFNNLLKYQCGTFRGAGRFALMEFSMTDMPFGYESALQNMIDNELIPIIAHPERNAAIIKDLRRAQNLVDCGGWLQVNSGSFLGKFGRRVRKTAFKLLDMDLIKIVASDAHNSSSRPPILSKARRLIAKHAGEYIADILFRENPEFVLSDTSKKFKNINR